MRHSGGISFLQRLTATFDRLPIRVRLAGVSALLTFVILCGFAVAVGSLTVRRIRSDFNREVADTASQLPSQLSIKVNPRTFQIVGINPPLQDLAQPENSAVIRILTLGGAVIAETAKAPSLGPASSQPRNVNGYRVLSHPAAVSIEGTGEQIGQVFVQYGRSVTDTEATVTRVELFLLIGVLIGTGVALFAGMTIARRAMAPIARLTSTAEEIARTRDPSRVMPQSEADDEVSELARTLQGMLRELDAARGETEAMLVRQRRFVADASHELRTPLTSVLVNLELLAESLHGDEGEAARSALRSSQRMRRLVADLLLLGAHRCRPHDRARAVRSGSDHRRGGLGAGACQRRARDLTRRRADGASYRRGLSRRTASPDDQPPGERAPPYPRRHRDPGIEQPGQ